VWDDPTKSPPMTTTSPASPTARAGLKLLAFAVAARLGWRRRRRRRSVSCPSARSTQQRSRRAGRSGLLTLSRLAMTLALASPASAGKSSSPCGAIVADPDDRVVVAGVRFRQAASNRSGAPCNSALALRRDRSASGVATSTATHPDATIVVRTVRDRLTAWVCGPQNPIQ
jgi:hypothetical protein